MPTRFDKDTWISDLPDDDFRAPPAQMFGGKVRKLDPMEQEQLRLAKEAGASQSEIARMQAELAGKAFGYGTEEYKRASEERGRLGDMLNSIMSGETSFIDDDTANKQWKRAREVASKSFEDVDRMLGERYSGRGLYGGGQHRTDISRYLTESQANALAQQGTEIYGEKAKSKAAERAAALSALLNEEAGGFNLASTLFGQGQAGYGSSGSQFGGAGNLYQGGLSTLTNRPTTKSIFEQIMGGVAGAAGAAFGTGGLFPQKPK